MTDVTDKVERAIARFDRVTRQLDERDGPARAAARRERQRLNAGLGRTAATVALAVGAIWLAAIVIGLVQPIGPTIPLVEIQAKWLAGVLSGRLRLPSRDEMHAEIARHRREVERTYVGSPRYTLEVDFRSYAGQLNQALLTGRA